MTNIRALNQGEGPTPNGNAFWDFVASMDRKNPSEQRNEDLGPRPWNWSSAFTAPHRHRSHHEHRRHHSPHRHEGEEGADATRNPQQEGSGPEEMGEDATMHPTPDTAEEYHHRGPSHRGRGGFGGRGGFRGGRHPCEDRRSRGAFGPGPWGMPGGPRGMPFDFPAAASWFANYMNPHAQAAGRGGVDAQAQDFRPQIDVFDTEKSYVVHVSLPGAAKEDIAVNWDADRSTLVITGVVHRIGDEEFLQKLEIGERQVGAFERKVVLGTTAEPASVDEDGIRAKLEDGVLRVQVPKVSREENFVEIKKVDIE